MGGAKVKILVVDDESIVRRAIERVATQRGHEVTTAVNGQEALDLWSVVDPDLVFLDVLMPGITGPEVLLKLGSQRRAKVVLISAYSGEYDLNKARDLGADAFYAKPFDNIFTMFDSAVRLVQ